MLYEFIHSEPKFNLPTYRSIYVALASRALQSGKGINYRSYTYFFHRTRTWRTSSEEGSAQCRGHLRESTNMKYDTPLTYPFVRTRRIWKDDYDGQMISGTVWLKLPDICLTGEENPRKTLPRKLVPTGFEPGPAAWQARMRPPAPQRWTCN